VRRVDAAAAVDAGSIVVAAVAAVAAAAADDDDEEEDDGGAGVDSLRFLGGRPRLRLVVGCVFVAVAGASDIDAVLDAAAAAVDELAVSEKCLRINDSRRVFEHIQLLFQIRVQRGFAGVLGE